MPVRVHVPQQLRRLLGAASVEEAPPGALAELIAALDERHAGLAERLLDPDGALRRHVNVFVDGEDVRWLDGAATLVPDGAEVRIVPSIAGG